VRDIFNAYIIILCNKAKTLLTNTLLGSDNDGSNQDTANTLSGILSLISSEVDITIATPRSTPRVLDNESFEETEFLVTDSQDSMVQRSTASLSDDTRAVELEDIFISLDGDGNGGVNEGSLKLIRRLGSDHLVTTSELEGLFLVVLAFSVSSSVGIVRFELDTVLGNISNSSVSETTVATLVDISVTINELLFSEGEELAVVDEVETFEDTGSRERPARTAVALILNRGNGTLVSPIDGVREDTIDFNALSVGFKEVLLGLFSGSRSIDGGEFVGSQVREFVKGESSRVTVFGVKSLDLLVVFNEDTESGNFFRSSVGFLVLSFPGGPETVESVSLHGGGETDDDKKEDNLVHFERK